MANQQENKPAEKKAATPAEISKTTAEVAALLAPFSVAEQWRIIQASASINGLPRQQQSAGGGKR
jgi:hypothetical protein